MAAFEPDIARRHFSPAKDRISYAVRLYFEPLVRFTSNAKAVIRLRRISPFRVGGQARRLEWLADVQIAELINLRRSIDELSDCRVRRIVNLVACLDHPWIKRLAETVVDRTITMLDGLAHPMAIYRNEAALYRALTGAVNALRSRDTLFAVCTEKSWRSSYVTEYFRANEMAVRRGALISRVFYESDSTEVMRAAEYQAQIGVQVRVLRKECLEDLMPIHRIPIGLGIAIINSRTVIMHSGLVARGISRHRRRVDDERGL